MEKNPSRRSNSIDIRTEFIEAGGSEIRVYTVRRRLSDKGLIARVLSKKPLLMDVMKQKRLVLISKYLVVKEDSMFVRERQMSIKNLRRVFGSIIRNAFI